MDSQRLALIRRTWKELQQSEKHLRELREKGRVTFYYKINIPDEIPSADSVCCGEPIPVLKFEIVKNNSPIIGQPKGWVYCEGVKLQEVI